MTRASLHSNLGKRDIGCKSGTLEDRFRTDSFLKSHAFRKSGNFVMRSGDNFLMIRCARINFGGVSCHNHNDALSFALQAAGRDFFIDPGTFSYTAYPDIRNRFRSTAAHNVIHLQGQEQNDFGKSVFDFTGDKARARCVKWKSNEAFDIFVGEHRGFRVGDREAICSRGIRFEKKNSRWIIEDELRLHGKRLRKSEPLVQPNPPSMEWRFHLHPNVTVTAESPTRVILDHGGSQLSLDFFVEGAIMREEMGSVSFRYASKSPTTVLSLVPVVGSQLIGRFEIEVLTTR